MGVLRINIRDKSAPDGHVINSWGQKLEAPFLNASIPRVVDLLTRPLYYTWTAYTMYLRKQEAVLLSLESGLGTMPNSSTLASYQPSRLACLS